MPNQKNSEFALAIICTISLCHVANDLLQALIFAIYPILRSSYNLSFSEIGIIGFVYQITASILQPLVGQYTDKNHKPFSLVIGMLFTFSGLLILSFANNFPTILLSVAIIGTGSSIFHPEASRVARIASNGRYGISQSLFQVGGNLGTAIGPIMAAFIILPHGQKSLIWFCLLAFIAAILLTYVGKWYKEAHLRIQKKGKIEQINHFSKKQIRNSIIILVILIFSKFFYTESIKSYYIFYLIHQFQLSIKQAQIHLFAFLISTAVGVFIGGFIGDKFGRKFIIWLSILGSLPFTLALPYCNLLWTEILILIIGLIISSAFSAILVYSQELIPGKVGTISGMFFGIGFGMAAIAAAMLGKIIDLQGIEFTYKLCSFLPLLGLLAYFLPNIKNK